MSARNFAADDFEMIARRMAEIASERNPQAQPDAAMEPFCTLCHAATPDDAGARCNGMCVSDWGHFR